MKDNNNLWKLSPSSLYGYTECQSCFWVDNHYKRAPMLPLLLNTAMDSILKNRYDKYRKKDTFPPEAQELLKEGIKPFQHLETLEEWREKTSALEVVDEKTGYILRGKIDDVLVEADGKLIPADYKSSGNAPREDKQKYYKDQLAAYGFMFKKHGHKVSNRAYLLHYFPKNKLSPALAVQFNGHVDLVKISTAKIEKKLKEMVELLDGKYPGYNGECDKCKFYKERYKHTK
jgi:hypothetical protein